MTTIYRPAAGWPATQTVLLLQQNGFTPNVAGSGVTENITLPSATGSSTVEISVPDEQVERAREFLERWDNYRLIGVQRQATTIRKHLLISLVIGAVLGGLIAWMLAGFSLPGFGQFATATVLVGAVSLVVIGHFWHAPEASNEFGVRCPKCDHSLAGLTVPHCPKCGTEFDEAVLEDEREPVRGE